MSLGKRRELIDGSMERLMEGWGIQEGKVKFSDPIF